MLVGIFGNVIGIWGEDSEMFGYGLWGWLMEFGWDEWSGVWVFVKERRESDI